MAISIIIRAANLTACPIPIIHHQFSSVKAQRSQSRHSPSILKYLSEKPSFI